MEHRFRFEENRYKTAFHFDYVTAFERSRQNIFAKIFKRFLRIIKKWCEIAKRKESFNSTYMYENCKKF